MDQGKIISRAWEMTWNNRMLWALGFLASLGASGGGAGSSFQTDSSTFNIDTTSSDTLPPFLQDGPLADLLDGDMDAVFALLAALSVFICLILIISIILWVVGQAARVGMIKNVVGLQNGQKMTFGAALRDGMSYIIPILGMKLLLYLVPFGLLGAAMAAITGISIGADASAAIILLCPIMLIAFVLIFALQFTDAYAYRGMVLNNMGVTEAIKHGWGLFRNNAADSLILGVIYGVISIVFGIVIGLVVGLLAFLSVNPLGQFLETGELSAMTAIGAAVAGLVVALITALLSSVITAWQSAGFTMAYQELTGMMVEPLTEKEPEDFGSISFDSMIDDSGREKGPADIDDGNGEDMI